jgi:ketosteroid isomerase-like protein
MKVILTSASADEGFVQRCSTTLEEVTMSTKLVFTLLACSCLFLIGCTQTPRVDTRADADEIRNIEAQWAAANKAKDINKAVGFFASDAVQMDPNKPISLGIEAIRRSWESWFSDTTYLHNTITLKIDTIEVSASGDLGYARGTTHYSLKTPNGPVEYADKFIDIYKKIDGKWKCIVGIWNTY